MEIERKYLIPQLPEDYRAHPCYQIEQGYLCTNPVVRIRRQDNDFYLTYKSKGLMVREEYNLPLTEVEFPSEEEANDFQPPEWFGEDVTFSGQYHNSALAQV